MKKCSKCKKEYLPTLKYFKPSKKTKDKLTSWCRFCYREINKIYSRKYREEHPEWKNEDNKRNSELIRKLVKEYNQKYPERIKASYIIYKAIKNGKIKRQPCMVCDNPKSHGHHQDYSKPLEVIWLCAKHHKAVHYGLVMKSGRSK